MVIGIVQTPVGNLMDQGTINHGIFTFYFGIDSPGMLTIGKKNHHIIIITYYPHSSPPLLYLKFYISLLLLLLLLLLPLGEIDESRIVPGGFDWVPLKQAAYWAIPMGAVTLTAPDGHILNTYTSSKSAIIDTGTSLILGPKAEVHSIASEIGALYSPGDGLYFLENCDFGKLPDISYKLGEKDYVLKPQDYLIPEQGLCVLVFQPVALRLWVMGDTFMTKYVAAFDQTNEKVGFGLVGGNVTAPQQRTPLAAPIKPVADAPHAEAAPQP